MSLLQTLKSLTIVDGRTSGLRYFGSSGHTILAVLERINPALAVQRYLVLLTPRDEACNESMLGQVRRL